MTLIRGLRRAHLPRVFNRRASSSGATGGRLPANTPAFFAEFPHGRLQDFRTRVRELRHLSRVALSRSIATLLRPQNVAGLAVTTLFAAAVGTAEGWQRAAAAAALLQAEIALAQDAEQTAQHKAREQQARLTAFIKGQKVEEGAGGGPLMHIAAAIGRVLTAVEKLKLGVQQWDEEEGEVEVVGLDDSDKSGLEAHGDLHTGSGGDAAGEEKTLEQAALDALGEELGRFAAVYGIEQIPAAFAMLTADPLQIAEAHGLWRVARLLRLVLPETDPNNVRASEIAGCSVPPLGWHAPPPASKRAAESASFAATHTLRAERLGYFRLALTQVVILTQMLRLVNAGLRAREIFRTRVLRGRQAPVPFAPQRVVRLCGEASDTGALSLERCGRAHLLPVFEHYRAVQPLARRLSHDGDIPFYWCVEPGTYGQAHAWRGLAHTAFSASTLLPRVRETATSSSGEMLRAGKGKRLQQRYLRPVLYLEADATNAAHALAFSARSSDLSVADAAMGFRMLTQLAQASPGLRYIDYDVMRVFLGYPDEKIRTGGGQVLTASQAMLDLGQADIFIDARAPILIQVLRWVINTGAREWHRTLVFATDTPAYFNHLRDLLRPHGFHVVDPLEPSRIVLEHLPYLVYYRTTMATVHQVETLVRQRIVPADRLCALLDHADGVEALDDLARQGRHVTHICTAETFDDVFRTVRCWVRQGFTASEIQRELHSRFSEVADLASEIAERHKATEVRRKKPSGSHSSNDEADNSNGDDHDDAEDGDREREDDIMGGSTRYGDDDEGTTRDHEEEMADREERRGQRQRADDEESGEETTPRSHSSAAERPNVASGFPSKDPEKK